MDDFMPKSDGPDNLRILKKHELKVGIHEGRQLSSLPLRHVVGILQISTDRDLKHRKMCRTLVGVR